MKRGGISIKSLRIEIEDLEHSKGVLDKEIDSYVSEIELNRLGAEIAQINERLENLRLKEALALLARRSTACGRDPLRI